MMPAGPGSGFGREFSQALDDLAVASLRPLHLGLIDCHRFSQECLANAFGNLQPRLAVRAFNSVEECTLDPAQDFDVILYHAHASDTQDMDAVVAVRQSFCVPLIVLSDVDDAQQPQAVRDILRQGAQGFIPTRTMGIPMIVAAIHFVKAGGTFAPLDLLLSKRPDAKPEPEPEPAAARPDHLTARQTIVLGHVQQGKANKIIAHELGMSESTVKVHVRNIMRKMGATNRTQAAYKAQGLCNARASRG